MYVVVVIVVVADLCRTLPRAICIGMPIIIVCYAIINLSFFAVLSVGEIVDATAVALVCVCVCMYVCMCVCVCICICT